MIKYETLDAVLAEQTAQGLEDENAKFVISHLVSTIGAEATLILLNDLATDMEKKTGLNKKLLEKVALFYGHRYPKELMIRADAMNKEGGDPQLNQAA